MTSIENNLALEIVKENYGELAKIDLVKNSKNRSLLIKKKSYPLQLIANDLNIENKIVNFCLNFNLNIDFLKSNRFN